MLAIKLTMEIKDIGAYTFELPSYSAWTKGIKVACGNEYAITVKVNSISNIRSTPQDIILEILNVDTGSKHIETGRTSVVSQKMVSYGPIAVTLTCHSLGEMQEVKMKKRITVEYQIANDTYDCTTYDINANAFEETIKDIKFGLGSDDEYIWICEDIYKRKTIVSVCVERD